MSKVLIPYIPPLMELDLVNSVFQKKNFFKNRNAILAELRCVSGIPKIVNQLNKDTVYKIVATPEGGKLFKDRAGNIKGVFYKDGKIVEHAKFRAIRPSLVKAATAIGSQFILISLAMQLNRIEKGISKIVNEFHKNRISEILSGANQYNQAMEIQDSGRQSRLIEHAIQTLNTGLWKTVQSLKMQIEEAPDTKMDFFDNWFTDRSKVASVKLGLAEESFQACLLGIKTLSECFAFLNEPQAAVSILGRNLSSLKNSGIKIAAQKARLVPSYGRNFSETPWETFLKHERSFSEKINKCNMYASNEFDCIEIEIKPCELTT